MHENILMKKTERLFYVAINSIMVDQMFSSSIFVNISDSCIISKNIWFDFGKSKLSESPEFL